MNSIHSYLAHIVPGTIETLIPKLEQIEYLEFYPDEKNEILILLYEAMNEEAGKSFERVLENFEEIKLLSFVFGAQDQLEVCA